MGTAWAVTIWDALSEAAAAELERTIVADAEAFNALYSRFKKDSLIWKLTETRGKVPVPRDLVAMLRLYEKLHDLSGGKCNPLVGFALSDLGYDADYSLTPKAAIRPVPNFHDALEIVDDETISVQRPCLIDLGALGKGYFVDTIAALLEGKGLTRFLVDGSGDVRYRGDESIRAGLEHPADPTKAIGVVLLNNASLCGSASNRRRWRQYHHTIDPFSLSSPEDVIATWVRADSAAVADGLATCLFLTPPELYATDFAFGWAVLDRDYRLTTSPGFAAEVF